MNTAALKDLSNFTGTENYYRMPLFPGIVYTDGAEYLATNADAFWLLDAIASYQPRCKQDESLRQMQFWTLKEVPQAPEPAPMTVGAVLASKTPRKKCMAVLVCERDSDDVAFQQEIEFTDFPFASFPNREVKLWVAPTMGEDGRLTQVCYLPSEH